MLSRLVREFEDSFRIVSNKSKKNDIYGNFSLKPNSNNWDLYGSIDAIFVYYISGFLVDRTDAQSRCAWAKKIIQSQDREGWFTKNSSKKHSKEHATAYAIAGLRLLEVEENESYVSQVKPLKGVKNIFRNRSTFKKWISRLGLSININDPVGGLGWHYIWRSSHIGGGVPAALGMTKELHESWWPGVNTDKWFRWYFEWLNDEVSPKTGYWQRALWNIIYKKPTLIDMAGAVHFYWIYEKYGEPLPVPHKIIESTLSVQRENGLYRDYPMCIDLDGNFCLTRSYRQLTDDKKTYYHDQVSEAINKNYNAIVTFLSKKNLLEIYSDSHGLPGALAALAECKKINNFKHKNEIKDLNNPFDKVWWL